MRKFFTAVVLIPLGLILVVFAVANRHMVTVSFDPFNSTDPSIAVTLPLFVVLILVAILGVAAGGFGHLGPAAPLAPRRAPARGRCQAGAITTGRGARRSFARRPAGPAGPAGGPSVWALRARQAGRDVVERRPLNAPLFELCRYPDLYLETMSLIVKICGLSTPETLDAALEAGAGHGGIRVLSAVTPAS